jgi:hypothetical protein
MEGPGKDMRFDLSSVGPAFEAHMRSRSALWLPIILFGPCALILLPALMLVFDGIPPPTSDLEMLVLGTGMPGSETRGGHGLCGPP